MEPTVPEASAPSAGDATQSTEQPPAATPADTSAPAAATTTAATVPTSEGSNGGGTTSTARASVPVLQPAVPPTSNSSANDRSSTGPMVDTTYTKVFVGGLAWTSQADTLRNYFEQFGAIQEAVVIMDRTTNRSKGYGFVTFYDMEAAKAAVQNGNPMIDNRKANCNLAALGAKKKSNTGRTVRSGSTQSGGAQPSTRGSNGSTGGSSPTGYQRRTKSHSSGAAYQQAAQPYYPGMLGHPQYVIQPSVYGGQYIYPGLNQYPGQYQYGQYYPEVPAVQPVPGAGGHYYYPAAPPPAGDDAGHHEQGTISPNGSMPYAHPNLLPVIGMPYSPYVQYMPASPSDGQVHKDGTDGLVPAMMSMGFSHDGSSPGYGSPPLAYDPYAAAAAASRAPMPGHYPASHMYDDEKQSGY